MDGEGDEAVTGVVSEAEAEDTVPTGAPAVTLPALNVGGSLVLGPKLKNAAEMAAAAVNKPTDKKSTFLLRCAKPLTSMTHEN